jgi:glucose/arabinose dehydrogenase
VTKGLDTPWSIAFFPDDGFLVTERGGDLRQFRDGRLLPPVTGTPTVWRRGQGGLLEVALHPDYDENGWIYLGYSETSGNGKGSTAIVRGRIRDNQWIDEEAIFNVPPKHHRSSGVHFGTRFVFKDGYLFFSIGDRGNQNSAQDPASPNGRIHRIYDDGRIPEDNPFVDQPDAYTSSWTLGNRNAQGLDAHPVTGDLWESEHGPRGGDEINHIRPGINYGWPEITYGMNYSGTPITEKTEAPGLEQPKLYWTPSIAVCGIDFYEGELFPTWRNDLFVGGLASNELRRLGIEDQQIVRDELILKGVGRIRDVASGPDGALYLLLNRPGTVVRLVPAE